VQLPSKKKSPTPHTKKSPTQPPRGKKYRRKTRAASVHIDRINHPWKPHPPHVLAIDPCDRQPLPSPRCQENSPPKPPTQKNKRKQKKSEKQKKTKEKIINNK